MKQAILYLCESRSLNDATVYYVGIIQKALEKFGYSFNKTLRNADIKNADVIVAITSRAAYKAKLINKKAIIIFWSQGVSAEEAIMTNKSLKNCFRYICRAFLAFCALHRSDLVFCVSEEMRRHYKSMYWYNGDNCIVMPCYNLPLSDYFDENQYLRPTFVYAGSADAWQGVDLMLDVYSIIEKQLPNSSLMLLSNQQESFIEKLRVRNIKNYEIKYVSVDKLQEELHKYKYGFIIRDNHIVNRVATPTKMNSYLSNYLIPIFSNTVDDFNQNIELGPFTIKATYPLDARIIANQIIKFEREEKDYSKLKSYVDRIFERHYNDEVYIHQISTYFKKMGF